MEAVEIKVYNDMGHLVWNPSRVPKYVSDIIIGDVDKVYETHGGYTFAFFFTKKEVFQLSE